MMDQDILNQLNSIFRTVFQDDGLMVTRELTAADVERWDSLTHIDMIVMVEEHFGIRIPSWQVGKLANVGELVDVIRAKKSGT